MSNISGTGPLALFSIQGMDVHDCSSYSKKQPLVPGMVITVEPGVYIPHGRTSVDKSWWGLGCRIEDDVLITENGVKVLSDACPKSPEEIQNIIVP